MFLASSDLYHHLDLLSPGRPNQKPTCSLEPLISSINRSPTQSRSFATSSSPGLEAARDSLTAMPAVNALSRLAAKTGRSVDIKWENKYLQIRVTFSPFALSA